MQLKNDIGSTSTDLATNHLAAVMWATTPQA